MAEDENENEQQIAEEIYTLKARLAELEARQSAATAQPKSPAPSTTGPTAGEGRLVIWSVVGLIGLVIFGIAVSRDDNTVSQTPTSTSSSANSQLSASTSLAESPQVATAIQAPQAEPQPSSPATNWEYSEDPDPMRDAVTKHACVSSSNSISLGWPYHDQQTRLCLRRSPKYGLDVIFELTDNGQLLCDNYSGCPLKVRFDSGIVRTFHGSTPADYSSTAIFMSPAKRLIAEIKKAKVTRIEVTLYQAGTQMAEFPTAGLIWETPPPRHHKDRPTD